VHWIGSCCTKEEGSEIDGREDRIREERGREKMNDYRKKGRMDEYMIHISRSSLEKDH